MLRKGFFTQIPYNGKELEDIIPITTFGKTNLDFMLYELTSSSKDARFDAIQILHPDNIVFKEMCYFAQLNTLRCYNMMLFFLKEFFPKVLKELYCYQKTNGGIVEFNSSLTRL